MDEWSYECSGKYSRAEYLDRSQPTKTVSCDMIHLLTVSVLAQYDVLLTEEYAGLLVKFYR